MSRHASRFALSLIALAITASTSQAQWGGWGGATAAGSAAAGGGVFAAGAGAYNADTAQARSMNAQTAMQWNDYIYQCNQRNASNELKRLQRRQQEVVETQAATYKRLTENPEPRDVRNGDALNIVLNDLINPKVYGNVIQNTKQEIPSELVRTIPFKYGAKMIVISLDNLSGQGVPDELATRPEFEADRQAIRAIVAKGRKEGESSSQISPDTLRSLRAAIQHAQQTVASILVQGTRQRAEADNFLKGLYGLSNMLQRPAIEEYLQGLKKYPTTTLGHLISFMHTFNLTFGAGSTPEEQAAYDQLYPLLLAARSQAQSQGGAFAPPSEDAPPPDPRVVRSHFSPLQFEQLQSRPTPAAPAPGR